MSNRLKYAPRIRNPKGIRFFKPLKYPSIPFSSDDIYVITTVGDRLDSLAHQFYNDIESWWIIAQANPGVIRRDSFSLKPNLEIRIPLNTASIKKAYNKLNT